MGGGLLGSDYVSKIKIAQQVRDDRYRHAELVSASQSNEVSELGSKEVSKKLRNFTLAPKKACHCEDERSEDVAIAKSLNINEITTQSMIARNDKLRHPERVSESITHPNLPLKREGICNYPLAPWGEGVRRTGEGSRVEGKVCKIAFTLAEVLITLGVIGVVSALTLPSVIANYKEKVLVTQVQKAYSEMQNALKLYSAQNNCSDISCISNTNQTSVELADRLYEQFQGAKKCAQSSYSKRRMCKAITVKCRAPFYSNGVTAGCDTISPDFVSVNGVAYHVIQIPECPRIVEQVVTDNDGFIVTDENGQPKKKQITLTNCALVYFDANGVEKGPNQFGADIYRFDLNYDGRFFNQGNMIDSVVTTGKLEYTPYKFGQSKK